MDLFTSCPDMAGLGLETPRCPARMPEGSDEGPSLEEPGMAQLVLQPTLISWKVLSVSLGSVTRTTLGKCPGAVILGQQELPRP